MHRKRKISVLSPFSLERIDTDFQRAELQASMSSQESGHRFLNCALGTIGLITMGEINAIKNFTIEVPNTKTKDLSPILKNKHYGEMDGTILEASTVHRLFERAAIMYADRPFLGRREVVGRDPSTGCDIWGEYKFLTYAEVERLRLAFGSGLMELLKKYACGGSVGKTLIPIIAEPCVEWVIADLGIIAWANVVCAIQTNTDPKTMVDIIRSIESPIVITTPERAGHIISYRYEMPKLKCVILVDVDPLARLHHYHMQNLKRWASEKGLHLYAYENIINMKVQVCSSFRLPEPDDMWCICYSSGSTGSPKGAIITHWNIITLILSLSRVERPNPCPVSRLFHLSIAHILEKEATVETANIGGKIYFTRGKNYIVEDLADVAPEMLVTVPRVLSRIMGSVTQKIDSMNRVSRAASRLAIEIKKKQLELPFNFCKLVPSYLLDTLFINRLKCLSVGPNLRELMSGSAPLREDVSDFIYAVTGVPVDQGYGLTETAGFISLSHSKGKKGKELGYLSPQLELRFKSIPEMKKYADKFEGEIWIRGSSVFKGYFKDRKATSEMLTDDGWCRTGDVGKYDRETGAIHIIGRVKVAFKLAQGEFVNPENVERLAGKSRFIHQLLLTGRSAEEVSVLLITPNREQCLKWIKNNIKNMPDSVMMHTDDDGNDELILDYYCNRPELNNAILDDVNRLCRSAGVKGYEIPKLLYIDTKERWSISNNCLSSLSKTRRTIIAQKYSEIIDSLYEDYRGKRLASRAKL